MTRSQFDAAELDVRREIAARVRTIEPIVKTKNEELKRFDPEELRLLDYFIERSFRLGRTAAYFRTYRELGLATQTFSHAHEALKRLVDKKVLVALPFSTKQLRKKERNNKAECWHWYGFNLNFSIWPEKQKRPDEFWEQSSLPDEFEDTLRETFIEISAGGTPVAATTETCGGRDAVPRMVPHADKDHPPTNSAGGSVSLDDSKAEVPVAQSKPVDQKDWDRLKKAIQENRVEEEFPDLFQTRQVVVEFVPSQGTKDEERTPGGYKSGQKPEFCTPESVPREGTDAYPTPQCTPGGYTTKPNNDAAKTPVVPREGTYPRSRAASIASSASVQKAELSAVFAAVPLQGTETFNEKVALALEWLRKIDTSAGLHVERFRVQWENTCRSHPDYVLKTCPYVLLRQLELHGDVPKPLALLSHVARKDGKMGYAW